MKKFLWPLTVMLLAVVGAESIRYVKTSNERERLFLQLQEVAEVASANSTDSPEARAAMERGKLIAAGWPCYWWEDSYTVRSKTAEAFESMIASKRERNSQVVTQPSSAR